MRVIDIIEKKRDGGELTREEIIFFVEGFTNGEIADYQAAAWAMAVLLNGMTPGETTELTLAMAESGDVIDLSQVVPIAVDKHSTGGVGDKTTLVVGPLVAASGLPVGKMSGHGLGFSGGTLDKMESIPGFRTDLSTQEFIEQLRSTGLVLTGQSVDLAPADGKLYALRDVTGTVPSIPLIASSIMSKKIAAGAHAIVLDVKVGVGAFMRNLENAQELAEMMVSIAKQAGRRAVAILSDMNQPLGYAVGNALEVREAIETMQGLGPPDFTEHCLEIASHMLHLGQLAKDEGEGRKIAKNALDSGRALDYFRMLVQSQGGDGSVVDRLDRLPQAKYQETISASHDGYLQGIHARKIGEAAVKLGAGRSKKGESIDHSVGIIVHHKVGNWVEAGEPLFTIHASKEPLLNSAIKEVLAAHTFSDDKVDPLPLVYGIVK
jgi:pyrimidine-nucleoside phosphorylase